MRKKTFRSCRIVTDYYINLRLAPTAINMAIFRQYIAPLLVVIVFFIALIAVSARIFLPTDMAAPAPVEQVNPQPDNAQAEFTGAVASWVRDLENYVV